jgi:hypothetical protein
MIDPTDYFPAETSKGPGEKRARLPGDFVCTRILIMRISSHLRGSRCAWIVSLYPNVANLLRGKMRQSVPDVAARRFGEDEAYLTVRDILSEASTVFPPKAGLSRERSGFYRCGFATLGFSIQTCLSPGKTGYVDPDETLNWQ